MKKALVVMSGGVDSTVALWWAKSKGWKIATLTFLYPGRKRRELEAVKALRKLSGSRENYDVNLAFLKKPSPNSLNYIPQKNLMYYSIAAALAEDNNADYIIGGHMMHDRVLFRDAGSAFLSKIGNLIWSGSNKSKPKLRFPFVNSGKEQIVRTGTALKVPFKNTWSCSRDGKTHCWKCASCRERMEGFSMAGIKDPLYGV